MRGAKDTMSQSFVECAERKLKGETVCPFSKQHRIDLFHFLNPSDGTLSPYCISVKHTKLTIQGHNHGLNDEESNQHLREWGSECTFPHISRNALFQFCYYIVVTKRG